MCPVIQSYSGSLEPKADLGREHATSVRTRTHIEPLGHHWPIGFLLFGLSVLAQCVTWAPRFV